MGNIFTSAFRSRGKAISPGRNGHITGTARNKSRMRSPTRPGSRSRCLTVKQRTRRFRPSGLNSAGTSSGQRNVNDDATPFETQRGHAAIHPALDRGKVP